MGVMSQMLQRCRISSRIQDHHVPIFKEIPFRVLDMEITAFETMHDVKSVGFSIEYEGERFVVATDMGIITDRAAYYMSRANYLMLECNYDKEMLLKGHYPQMLKDRVMGDKVGCEAVTPGQCGIGPVCSRALSRRSTICFPVSPEQGQQHRGNGPGNHAPGA